MVAGNFQTLILKDAVREQISLMGRFCRIITAKTDMLCAIS